MNKPKISETKFADIELGQKEEFELGITEKMLKTFAELSGDFNPLHIDEEYAKETDFKGRVVHGMLLSSFFSKLIGMCLPGKYALYLSQSLRFRSPARVGMKIIVRGIVEQIVPSLNTIKIQTEIIDSEKMEVLVDGEAMVKVLK